MTSPDELSDLQICRWALAGEVGLLDAAQALFANHPAPEDPWDIEISEVEALYELIAAVEVAGVPRGAARQFWNAQALADKDRLQEKVEAQFKPRALLAFQAIIDDHERLVPRGYYTWPRSAPQ